MSYTIRRANVEDAEGILGHIIEILSARDRKSCELPKQPEFENIKKEIERVESYFELLIEDNGCVKALVTCAPLRRDELYLSYSAEAPYRYGDGFRYPDKEGNLIEHLVLQVIEWAKSTIANRIVACIREDNSASLRIVNKVGFRKGDKCELSLSEQIPCKPSPGFEHQFWTLLLR